MKEDDVLGAEICCEWAWSLFWGGCIECTREMFQFRRVVFWCMQMWFWAFTKCSRSVCNHLNFCLELHRNITVLQHKGNLSLPGSVRSVKSEGWIFSRLTVNCLGLFYSSITFWYLKIHVQNNLKNDKSPGHKFLLI